MEIDELSNTYGTIRKRKQVKPMPTPTTGTLSRSNGSTTLGDSAPKRKKPLPTVPGAGPADKENKGDNTPLSCSRVEKDDHRKVLPNSPSHVLSPKQRRISKGKKSMSPKTGPARPKNWTLSDRVDNKLILEKEAAIKDVEYILNVISEYQKRARTLCEEGSGITRLQVSSKIDNDVSIINRTLSPLCIGSSTTAPMTPSKTKALTYSTEGDEAAVLENKLFLIAKKMIEIKAVIEKTESEKRTAVLTKIVTAIKHYLVTGENPNNIAVPVEMAISLINHATASCSILEDFRDNTYRSGFLKKQGRKMKILRKRWCAMDHHQFQIFDSSRSAKKSIPLDSITNLTCTLKEGYYHMVITTPGKKATLASKNRIEMAIWVLTIDSMIRPEFDSVITSPNPEGVEEKSLSKEQLLSLLYKEPFGSGKMTSETYEEFWHYNGATGALCNSKWGDALEYIWDGSTLAPSKMSQMTLGHGKWNGVWLAWYTEKNAPFIKYYYSAGDRKYLASHGQELLTWQWALNQLVGEGGEWICDGNIPHPVVMFLQMMRYYRLGR